QRTTAHVDDYSASFGHQRRQIIFRCVVRGCDHENDWAPHSCRCQHMMVLQAERCKIDYGDRSAIPSEPPSLARLSAALASDGGGEGLVHPLGGPEHRDAISQFNSGFCDCVTTALQAEASVPSQCPLDATVFALQAADVLADALLEEGLPGHELKAELILDHRE